MAGNQANASRPNPDNHERLWPSNDGHEASGEQQSCADRFGQKEGDIRLKVSGATCSVLSYWGLSRACRLLLIPCNRLIYLVAGPGFEPGTFGL